MAAKTTSSSNRSTRSLSSLTILKMPPPPELRGGNANGRMLIAVCGSLEMPRRKELKYAGLTRSLDPLGASW